MNVGKKTLKSGDFKTNVNVQRPTWSSAASSHVVKSSG